MAILERYAVDLIIFTETDGVSPLFRHAQDTLLIVETYDHDQKNFSVRDSIGIVFHDEIQIIRHRAASDTITIIERFAEGTQDRSCIDTINIVENYNSNLDWFVNSDLITFTETNSYTISKPISDLIEFTETYAYNIIRHMSVTDTITIIEGYNGFLPDPYNPSYNIPNTTGTDPVMLRDGSLEFESRHYEFGNTENIEHTRVVQESRGGDLIVGPTTNRIETLNFTFLQLSESKCNELLLFVRLTLGKEVELRDHEGTWWDGIIMNPGMQRTQVGRQKFTMSVQFEGVRQE